MSEGEKMARFTSTCDERLSKYHWPFSLSLYSDFLVLPGALTQIGSHVQTHREEWQEAEKVGIGWGRGRKSVVKKGQNIKQNT